jgi:hypothetical protein
VDAQFKPWVCGCSLAGMVGSNYAEVVDVLFVVGFVCSQVKVSATG